MKNHSQSLRFSKRINLTQDDQIGYKWVSYFQEHIPCELTKQLDVREYDYIFAGISLEGQLVLLVWMSLENDVGYITIIVDDVWNAVQELKQLVQLYEAATKTPKGDSLTTYKNLIFMLHQVIKGIETHTMTTNVILNTFPFSKN